MNRPYQSAVDLASEPDFALGGVQIRPSSREVLVKDQQEVLEPRVMQVLVALARERGSVISRERLVELCWGGRAIGEDAVNRCIARLRRLAEAHGGFCVDTITRVGYRLIESVADGAVPTDDGCTPSIPAPTAGKPRLAVLPFQNHSPDPANAFFTDGLHGEILSTLAMRGKTMEVVPRTTMMMFRHVPQAIGRISAELAATHIMEGSVRREGDSVRVTVQLIDARTQQYKWSRTYDRQLVSALTLQTEISGEIVAQLTTEVAGDALRAAPVTIDPEAYDLYLKARLLQASGARDQAAILFDQALSIDPAFGAAYAARAHIHGLMLVDNSDATEQRLRLMRADIDAARRLLGEAEPLVLFMEAIDSDLVTDDHALTIKRLEAAEAAGASDPYVMWNRAAMLLSDDRIDEALQVIQTIAARDSGNVLWLQNVPTMLGAAHRPIEALRLRRVIMERFPQLPYLAAFQGRMIFGFSGKTAPLRIAFDRVRSVLSDSQALAGDWDLLRFERRYSDLKRALGSLTSRAIPVSPFGAFLLFCAGRRPTAVYLGWAELLNENTALAADAGHAVLEFIAHEPQTRWNPWFLKTLAAEAHLMIGNHGAAITAAREALVLMPRKKDTLRSRYASAVAARVFAWAGAEDEAVTLLEQLATLRPGLMPAEITRDPLYFIPLTENSRYRAFAERLEVQIENYAAEFRKLHLDSI